MGFIILVSLLLHMFDNLPNRKELFLDSNLVSGFFVLFKLFMV